MPDYPSEKEKRRPQKDLYHTRKLSIGNNRVLLTALTTEDIREIQTSGPYLSEFDIAVNDAVISLYVRQKEMGRSSVLVTDAMICRVLKGDIGGNDPGPKLKEAVNQSMRKLNIRKADAFTASGPAVQVL